VRAGGGALGPWGGAYLVLALASQVALLFAATAALPLLLSLSARLRALAWALAPLLAAAGQLYLFSDRTLYAVLGLHVDGGVLRLLATPGGLASLGMQRGEALALALGAGAVVAAEALGLAFLALRARPGRPGLPVAALAKGFLAATVLLFSAERATYVSALAAGWRAPVRAAEALPGSPVEEALRTRLTYEPRLRPTLAPLRTRPVADPPSILWIVVESWRADALAPDAMPATWRFAQGATRFTNHRSGGNWTYAGVFSMFYGLHAAYSRAAEEARRGPVLLARARELGYDVRVVAARTTRFPRFRDTVFAGLPEAAVEDDLGGADAAELDRKLVARARELLAGADPARPLFLALFLDSTHLPYAFSPENAIHRPYTERLYYTEMTEPQDPEPIRNRYRNALREVDRSVGEILAALERSGRADETIVVLTGDHGQEFYEHGALGHNIAFDAPQTAVPLVLKVPGEPPRVHAGLTRHVDIAPTLLARLGVESPPEEYALGVPLGAGPPDRAVMCGWRACAVLDARGYTTEFRPDDPLWPPRVWDEAWRPVDPALAAPELALVRRELAAFTE
jgi:membrane-anchored protein YejM (alkaline phosphatase superfamily)